MSVSIHSVIPSEAEESVNKSPAKRLNYDHAHRTWFSMLNKVKTDVLRQKSEDVEKNDFSRTFWVSNYTIITEADVSRLL